MKTASAIISNFIEKITASEIFSSACTAIRAYEGGALPVPIKKIYYSFSCEENTVYYVVEDGIKKQVNDITVRMNAYIPLKFALGTSYSLTENILILILASDSNVTKITAGQAEYDSDVDAYRITSRIYMTYKD